MLKKVAKNIFFNDKSSHYQVKFIDPLKRKQVNIVAKIRDKNGVIRYAENKVEAKLAITQYIANGGSIETKVLKEKGTLLVDAISEYIHYCELLEKKRTDLIESYCNYFLEFLADYRYRKNPNNIFIDEITTNDFIKYMQKRKTDRIMTKTKNGEKWTGRYVSNSTINRELNSIKGLFRYLYKKLKILKVNPCEDLTPLPVNKIEKIPPNAAQEEEILKLASEDYVFFVMLIMLDTLGVRRGEIHNLKWQDVHLENDKIFNHGYIDFVNRKNGKNLRLPLSYELRMLIDKLPRMSEYVFTNPKTMTKYGDRYKKLNRILEKVGVKKLGVGYHIFRHNTASNLERSGVEASTIKDILGNSENVVMGSYLNQGIERKQEVINISCERIRKYITICETEENRQKIDKSGKVERHLKIV